MQDRNDLQNELNAAKQEAATMDAKIVHLERELADLDRPRILEPEIAENKRLLAIHDENLQAMIEAAQNGNLGQLAGAYETAIASWKVCRAFADKACARVAQQAAQNSPMAKRTEALAANLPDYMRDTYVAESMVLELNSQYVQFGRELVNPIHPDYLLMNWSLESESKKLQRKILVRSLLGEDVQIFKADAQEQSDRDVTAFRSRRTR